jgi:hypothetical protein
MLTAAQHFLSAARDERLEVHEADKVLHGES